MNQQYETANITYKGLTDGKLTVTVLDDKKQKWTVWKLDYKDKLRNSDAYDALLGMRLGDSFGVSYKESDESFVNQQGQEIKFKKRTIYSIMPIISQPTSELKASKPSITENEEIPLPEEFPTKPQDAFGRRLALHGFVNARLANHTIEQVKSELQSLLELEDLINSIL